MKKSVEYGKIIMEENSGFRERDSKGKEEIELLAKIGRKKALGRGILKGGRSLENREY